MIAASSPGSSFRFGLPLTSVVLLCVLVAASAGAAYVFRRSASGWAPSAYVKASNTGAGDSFGISMSMSADGATLVVGALGEASSATGLDGDAANDDAMNAGAVYVF